MNRKRVPLRAQVEAEPGLAVGVEAEPAHDLAVLDEALSQAHEVENLQRARVDRDGPGLEVHPVALVDDARRDAPRQQVRGQHQAGGAGADHQDLAIRASCPPGVLHIVHAANAAPGAAVVI